MCKHFACISRRRHQQPNGALRAAPSLSQAHTNVDVRVDIDAFRALLADRLPLVFAGWPVEAAAIPWPVQEGAEEAEAAEAAAEEGAEF